MKVLYPCLYVELYISMVGFFWCEVGHRGQSFVDFLSYFFYFPLETKSLELFLHCLYLNIDLVILALVDLHYNKERFYLQFGNL